LLVFCAEFRDATVAYNLESPTVPLDEVFFPSMVVCNMNTLRCRPVADPKTFKFTTTTPAL
jgi:hypothetical protein